MLTDIRLHMAGLAIAIAAVFYLQSDNVGFFPGHYGWVSSHVRAQISHATPENGFLGHSLNLINEQGQADLYYFDRYPVFFSGAMNRLLILFDQDLESQITAGKWLMNSIFALLVVACYFLLNLLFGRPQLSFITTILVMSSATILYYKDMVHFDQPALLGVMVLLWSILKFEKDEKSKWVYFIAPIAAVMGRGYVSVFVLFVWLLQRLYKKRKWLREPALWVTVTTILVTGSFLAHNVYQEAKIRNVSIFETNIIASAKSRLGVSEMNPELERKARLSKAVVLQIEGLIMNLMPGAMGSPQEILVASRRAAKSVGGVLVLLGVAAVFLYFLPRQVYRGWRRIEPWQKSAGILFMGYGFLWGIVMRKLTAFHQYTQMFLLPAAIFLVAIALLDLFERKPSRNFLKSSILIAFTLFVLGLVKIKSLHDQNLEDGRLQIAEAQRVLEALPAEGAKIFVEGGYRQLVPGAPFAAGYFFSRHFLAPAEFAEYVITASLREGEPLLNPGAVKFFLYKNSAN